MEAAGRQNRLMPYFTPVTPKSLYVQGMEAALDGRNAGDSALADVGGPMTVMQQEVRHAMHTATYLCPRF